MVEGPVGGAAFNNIGQTVWLVFVWYEKDENIIFVSLEVSGSKFI